MSYSTSRTGEEIATLYGSTYDDIEIVVNGDERFTVDRACQMTFATRQYIANLVVAAIKLGRSMSNGFTTPCLNVIKSAVEQMVELMPPDRIQKMHGSIEAENPHVGDLVGRINLDGWNRNSDWLTMESPRRRSFTVL